MNRRDFVKSTAALAALPALPAIASGPKEIPSVHYMRQSDGSREDWPCGLRVEGSDLVILTRQPDAGMDFEEVVSRETIRDVAHGRTAFGICYYQLHVIPHKGKAAGRRILWVERVTCVSLDKTGPALLRFDLSTDSSGPKQSMAIWLPRKDVRAALGV